VFLLNGNKERTNNINAATIIEGPEAVLNSKELNRQIITDKIPPKTENIII
jgi:hypothetical protein